MTSLDMAFCVSKNCKNECGRKLTQEIKDASEKYHRPLSLSTFCGSEVDFLEKGVSMKGSINLSGNATIKAS